MEKNMSDNGETPKEKPTVSFYILWSVVGLMLFYALFSVFREKGFCFNKMAFLQDIYTEQQLVDKAILYSLNEVEIPFNIIDNEQTRKKINYLNLEEFKKINPNCCQFTKSAEENYTHPDYNGFIKMEYVTFYGEEKDFSQVNHFYIAYDSCGNLYHRYYIH